VTPPPQAAIEPSDRALPLAQLTGQRLREVSWSSRPVVGKSKNTRLPF